MKRFLIILFTFFISVIQVFAQNEDKVLPSNIGLVENVEYVEAADDIAPVKQLAEIKLLKGDLKNKKILIENVLTGNPYFDINLKKGVKVILHVEEADGELNFAIEDVKRSDDLVLLSLLFCGLLVFVGKIKGFNSLISIVITAILIFYLLSPMILAGVNPILATILICVLSTLTTMYLVGGFNQKSTSASLGCILSLVVAGILSYLTVKLASLTGFSSEHSVFLYSAHPELSFVGIVISTMILATLGAVMDVAMSIASTINEIYTLDNEKTVKELFSSGMNVGRDIIGTMANTLILVYLGGSLPLLLLSANIDLQKFINLNQVVTEISAALIGSCAIVICVPITALVASQLVKNISPKVVNFKGISLDE